MGHSEHTIILSISSDIGMALAQHRLADNVSVSGTYRTLTPCIQTLAIDGADLVYADFSNPESIDNACHCVLGKKPFWTELIIAPATLEPIGLFVDIDFDQWADSFSINFLNQLRAIHQLLPFRRPNSTIVFFAGGGTNSATNHYSAYTSSKIAMIKMTELLDSEIHDSKFVILGPGWISTKIHQQTLNNKSSAGSSYLETVRRIKSNEFGSMDSLIKCIDWVIEQPKAIVGGKNISVQHDNWGSDEFIDLLRKDQNIAKLRRHGNHLLGIDQEAR